jgi:hypothetical protein
VADEDLNAEMEANDCFNAMDPTRLWHFTNWHKTGLQVDQNGLL